MFKKFAFCLIFAGTSYLFIDSSDEVASEDVLSQKGRGCSTLVSIGKCDDEVTIQGNAFFCEGNALMNIVEGDGNAKKLFGAVCYLPGFPRTAANNCGIWTQKVEHCDGTFTQYAEKVVTVVVGGTP